MTCKSSFSQAEIIKKDSVEKGLPLHGPSIKEQQALHQVALKRWKKADKKPLALVQSGAERSLLLDKNYITKVEKHIALHNNPKAVSYTHLTLPTTERV